MRKFIFSILFLLLPLEVFSQVSWQTQNSGVTVNLYDVYFVNQLTGWAVGDSGKVIKTINGGASWSQQVTGTTFILRKVHFINPNTGWITGGFQDPACQITGITLKTSNGGTNWITQYSSGGYMFTDLGVVDENTIYTTGEGRNSSCLEATGTTMYSTTSGTTWNFTPLSAPRGYLHASVDFTNAETGYIATVYAADVAGSVRRLFKTTNHGTNWNLIKRDSLSVPQQGGSFIRFINDNTGYFIDKNFYKTTDAGANWTKLDSVSVFGMSRFSFLNTNTGFVVGQNKIAHTFNGGTNWTVNTGAQFTSLNSIHAVDSVNVWACGREGKIIHLGNAPEESYAKYLPLKVGNSWTYSWMDQNMQTGYYKRTITRDTVIDNVTYYNFNGLSVPGFTSGLVTLDSITGNVYGYVPGYNCPAHPNRKLIDSLAARKTDSYYFCGTDNHNTCSDTSDMTIFGNTIKTKSFAIPGLIDIGHRFGKGFGLVGSGSWEVGSSSTNLVGCVIDGSVYGDTTAFSKYTPYFPLQVGNSWTYLKSVAPFPDQFVKVTITGQTFSGGLTYYQTNVPFPTFQNNSVALDTASGNIYVRDINVQCGPYGQNLLMDSLAAKPGDSIRTCSVTHSGICTDTNRADIFGSNILTKRIISPHIAGMDLAQRFGKGFGIISATLVEVDIQNYTLTGCVLNGTIYGDTSSVMENSVQGIVRYSDNNQIATNGYVKAIKLNKLTQNIITLDSVQLGSNGTYTLNNLAADTCYIVAYPNSESQADFVPTYFPSTINWQTAVKVYTGNNPDNINVLVYRKADIAGIYSLGGWVITMPNSLSAGIKDAIVYIKKNNMFRKFITTDNIGHFNLSGFSSGQYEVIVDRLGFINSDRNIEITNYNMDTLNLPMIPATNIKTVSDIVPDKFNLYQNFPNPFNPTTNIKFDIPKASFTTLKVYNVLGKEVAVLLNEIKSAGSYQVDFDASKLTSGVYFYRIETGSFTETRRLVILK